MKQPNPTPKTRTLQICRIATPCKWCHGHNRTCSHCHGTGDHDYRANNNQITYKWVTIGRIIQ